MKAAVIAVFVMIAGLAAFQRADKPVDGLLKTYFYASSRMAEVSITTADGTGTAKIGLHYTDEGGGPIEGRLSPQAAPLGPTIVLLHGMFASLHTFDPWTRDLVAAGYRVIRVDLPGHGLTGPWPDGVTSTRRSAAAVKGLLDSLGVRECVLAGNSMGGGVSWYMASEYHGVDAFSVKGLVLIDAVYPSVTSAGASPRTSGPVVSSLLRNVGYTLTPKFLFRNALRKVYGSASKPESATVDRYYDMLLRAGNRKGIVSSQTELPRQDDMSGVERLARISKAGIPTLVMWGAEDTWINVSNAGSFKESLGLADAFVKIYPGRGHVPMEEAPEETAADMLAFLSGLGPRP